MVDTYWHNVEIKVQQCFIAVKLQFRGSLVILKQNELQLKLILSYVVASDFRPPDTLERAFLALPFFRNTCVPLSLYGGQRLLSLLGHDILIKWRWCLFFSTQWGAGLGLGGCWNGTGLDYTLILLITKCIDSCLTNHHPVLPVVLEPLLKGKIIS